jgi:hypothetical protein
MLEWRLESLRARLGLSNAHLKFGHDRHRQVRGMRVQSLALHRIYRRAEAGSNDGRSGRKQRESQDDFQQNGRAFAIAMSRAEMYFHWPPP